MTVPTLVHDAQIATLQTGFKAGYSILNQGVTNFKREDGENIRGTYAQYDAKNEIYHNRATFPEHFFKHSGIKRSGSCYYRVYNRNKTAVAYSSYAEYPNDKLPHRLQNGMCMSVFVNCHTILLGIDVNGPKTPNRLGYDIFYFSLNSKDQVLPIKMTNLYTEEELEEQEYAFVAGKPCSNYSKQAGNGAGCSYFALVNKNPDNPSQSYWSTLP